MSCRDLTESFGSWDAFGPWCVRSDVADEATDPDPEAVIYSAIDALDVELDEYDTF